MLSAQVEPTESTTTSTPPPPAISRTAAGQSPAV